MNYKIIEGKARNIVSMCEELDCLGVVLASYKSCNPTTQMLIQRASADKDSEQCVLRLECLLSALDLRSKYLESKISEVASSMFQTNEQVPRTLNQFDALSKPPNCSYTKSMIPRDFDLGYKQKFNPPS